MNLYRVKVKDRIQPIEVDADYFTIEQGALTLKLSKASPREYPAPVSVFAHGYWQTIEVEYGR